MSRRAAARAASPVVESLNRASSSFFYAGRDRRSSDDDFRPGQAAQRLPHFTTLSLRTTQWVREIKDGVMAHRWKTRVFLFLYDPSSSTLAYCYLVAMNLLSIFAIGVYGFQESHLEGRDDMGTRVDRAKVLYYINVGMLAIFGAELVVRVLTHPLWRTGYDAFVWVDSMALVPRASASAPNPRPSLSLAALAREAHVGVMVLRAAPRLSSRQSACASASVRLPMPSTTA